jgi:hypothetical protein
VDVLQRLLDLVDRRKLVATTAHDRRLRHRIEGAVVALQALDR